MPHSEIIIEIAGEGGSITLLGARTAQGWRFSRSTNESIDEAFARDHSEPVESWEAALGLLDQYPWHKLYPLQVHPDFRNRVWNAVKARFERDRVPRSTIGLERWRELCSGYR